MAAATPGPPDRGREVVLPRDPGRRRRGHVGAERQLRVDGGLLVVGRREDPEVDAEREQQPNDDQPAVDRRAPPAGAGEQEAAQRLRASAGDSPRQSRRARARAA